MKSFGLFSAVRISFFVTVTASAPETRLPCGQDWGSRKAFVEFGDPNYLIGCNAPADQRAHTVQCTRFASIWNSGGAWPFSRNAWRAAGMPNP